MRPGTFNDEREYGPFDVPPIFYAVAAFWAVASVAAAVGVGVAVWRWLG